MHNIFQQTYIPYVNEYPSSPFKETYVQVPSTVLNEPFPAIEQSNDLSQEAYDKLQRKHKKLKKTLNEYKVLNKLMQEENERYKSQSIKTQRELKKMQRKNKKISDTTLAWIKKYRFQIAKT